MQANCAAWDQEVFWNGYWRINPRENVILLPWQRREGHRSIWYSRFARKVVRWSLQAYVSRPNVSLGIHWNFAYQSRRNREVLLYFPLLRPFFWSFSFTFARLKLEFLEKFRWRKKNRFPQVWRKRRSDGVTFAILLLAFVIFGCTVYRQAFFFTYWCS